MKIPEEIRSREAIEFLTDRFLHQDEEISFETCPKCGIASPKIIRSGHTGKGRQMYRCTFCHRRFLSTSGSPVHYSHQDSEVWRVVISDTLQGKGPLEISAKVHLDPSTVVRMRSRFRDYVNRTL